MLSIRSSALCAAALSVCSVALGVSPLTIKFKNSSGRPDAQVYIGFLGSADLAATNIQTGAPLAQSTFASPNWYTLDTLPQGVSLTSFSGRVYVGYGTPWVFARAGYEPSPMSPDDPNYLKTYDKVEFTYHGNQADVADVTSIDYFSIRTALTVSKNGAVVKELKDCTTSQALDVLGVLTNPQNASVVKNGNEFVRIIGPGVYPAPPGLPASHYDDFGTYLAYLHDTYAPAHGGNIATIAGQFNGVGPAPVTPETKPQTYNFTASLNANLDLTLSGSGGEIGPHTLLITKSQLTSPTGIYGANPKFYLDLGPDAIDPANDVYGWILGDLLAGMNIGAVGSNTLVSGSPVGQMQSQLWFGLSSFFDDLQPGQPKHYNQWAAAMSKVSDAYNFAYSDRFAHVVVPLDPAVVDTMEIDIGDAGTNNCPADLNQDGLVNDDDFVIFVSAYNILDCADPLMPSGCPADLNGDSVVDDADFVMFVPAYNALVCP